MAVGKVNVTGSSSEIDYLKLPSQLGKGEYQNARDQLYVISKEKVIIDSVTQPTKIYDYDYNLLRSKTLSNPIFFDGEYLIEVQTGNVYDIHFNLLAKFNYTYNSSYPILGMTKDFFVRKGTVTNLIEFYHKNSTLSHTVLINTYEGTAINIGNTHRLKKAKGYLELRITSSTGSAGGEVCHVIYPAPAYNTARAIFANEINIF